MNKRIKKKLNNRLNFKKYDNAPNCDIITDRNIYHKKHIHLTRFLHGNQLFDEDDMVVFRSKPSDEFVNYLNKKGYKGDS
jgi:ribosomal protein S4